MKTSAEHIRKAVRALAGAVLAALVCAAATSCSTTKRIPEGEQLYIGVKDIDVEAPQWEKVPDGVKTQLTSAVGVPPNNALFKSPKYRIPFPLGLWVYNNWDNPKKGLKHWLYEKLVTEPVLVSDVRPNVRTKMAEEILDNNGYFRGNATCEVLTQKNPRKAKISYTITTGPAYTLDSIMLLPDTCRLNHLIDSLARADSYLRRGERYCTDSLSAVRTRITNRLRNRGFYFFRPDYIEYLADSIANPQKIDLQLMLASNIPPQMLRSYVTGDVTIYAYRNQGGGVPDTIHTSRGTLIQMRPSRLRRQLIPECVTFRKGRTFSVRDMNATQTRLARLGIFNNIGIEVAPDSGLVDNKLNVNINCTFDTPLETTIELNASSKSNSYIGPGALIGITNRNIFGGGEQFSVTLTGNYEWQTGKGNSSVFNSYEAGITTSLAVPRLLAPNFIKRRNRNLNWTRFSLNFDILNRPHYFKMAQFNFSFSYDWQSSRYSSHTFTPFKLTYTNLLHTTHAFDSITAANPAIALSFRSQYIPQLQYAYVYDCAFDRDNSINWQLTVQEAGNLFWCVYQLAGKHHNKELFGTPFSQFVKGSTQLVYNRRLWGENWLVSRVAVGAAHAYGNSTEVPYAEQFYVGGANSVRAFTVRSLGPGSYRPPQDVRDSYFDQTGTFKFEANVEYRFPIIGPVHGAVFLDAGNVWLLKKDELRPGGELQAKTFLRDIALGTGAGLRLDISMLVVRADLGIGIHAPYATSRRGYYNMETFGSSLAFHLAIGYPF